MTAKIGCCHEINSTMTDNVDKIKQTPVINVFWIGSCK